MDNEFKKNIQILLQYPEWRAYEAYLKKWLKDIEVIKYEKGDDLNVIGAKVVGMNEMKRLLENHLREVSVIAKQIGKRQDDQTE
jgi:hypothetical protein